MIFSYVFETVLVQNHDYFCDFLRQNLVLFILIIFYEMSFEVGGMFLDQTVDISNVGELLSHLLIKRDLLLKFKGQISLVKIRCFH